MLLQAKRYESAVLLAALSIEESGKDPIIRGILTAKSRESLLRQWREFRSHTSKNRMWPFVSLAASGARRLDDFSSLFDADADADADHGEVLDQLKQLATYVDCLSGSWWTRPELAARPEVATFLVHTASILSVKKEVSEPEMSLWMEYMGSSGSSDAEMRASLLRWEQECERLGLRDAARQMHEFLYPGPQPIKPTDDMRPSP